MENEDIIKLAVRLTEENNSLYKSAAREQAFMIKADDGSGYDDTFITVKGKETADDWKNAFTTAGFTNVIVSPFRTGGNLNIIDVTPAFLKEVQLRPKWEMQHSPTGSNTPFTDYNPYAGTDKGFDSRDTRFNPSGYSYEGSNEYQKYILDQLKTDEAKIFSGWYGGTLFDWVLKIKSLSSEMEEKLNKEYANLVSSPQLAHYFDQVKRRNPEYKPKNYAPDDLDINYYGIQMEKLETILGSKSVKLYEYPSGLILPELNSIIEFAKNHKFHKQYNQKDMDSFQQGEIDKQRQDYANAWILIRKILKGMAR